MVELSFIDLVAGTIGVFALGAMLGDWAAAERFAKVLRGISDAKTMGKK